MDSMSDTAATEHNDNHITMGLDESYDEVEQLEHKTKKQKVSNDSENSNIDSALLGETQRDPDDHDRHDENDEPDVSLQDEETNHRDVAAAAVSATYDELLRNNAVHHVDINVSVDDVNDEPDTTLQTTQLDGKKAPRMAEHVVDKNDDEDKNDDDIKSVKEQDESTRSEENNESDSQKKLAKKNRRVLTVTGTEEWRQQRKDSHKEVERRRRESINYHINTLSQLLPVRETSKAAILSRAAEYIEKLKETENANIEKWTLQKLLSEQNASSLATANEKLQEELGNAYKENDFLRKLLQKNNVKIPHMDTDLEKSKDD